MRSLAVIIFCLLSSKAFAYPIFFSCKADKSLSAVLTPAELASKLNQLAAASQGKPGFNKQNELHEACTNLNDCLRDFAQLLDLAKETGRTAQDELMRDITDRAKTSMQAMKDGGFLRISGQDMNFLEQFHELQTKNYQCQMARASQPAEKVKAGSRCMLGNFGHSPYMYVSGVRKSCVPNGEERAEGPVGCEAIDRIVEGAIAMGQDPFAALAISFMEQGTAISGLYLDPIGKVHSVGCATAPVSAAAANAWNEQMRSSQPYKACQDACNNGVQDYQQCYDQCGIRFNRPYNLESYSTFYKVNRETRTDPALIKKLRDYVKLNNESGAPIVNSPSKYCPVEGCCLSLDFKADHASIEKALRFTALQDYVRKPLAPQHQNRGPGETPARRLQRFNGFTDLMGGAEGVPAWRSGVNYGQTPVYGYQAMDFILNTLMSNPYVLQKVKEAESKVGRKSPSVVCEDLAAGSYTMDSDFYFKKHGQAPRMGTIKAKWDSGAKTWDSLSKRQQKVLANEIAQLKNDRSNQELRRALNGRVPASEVEAFLAEDADTGVSFDVRRAQAAKKRYDFYMKHVLPLRSTVAAAAKMDLGYDWKPMNDQQFQCMLDEVKQFSQRSGGFDQSAAQQGALPGGAQPFEDGPSDVDYEIDGQEGM